MIEMIEAREARSGPIARALIGLNYLHLDRSEAPRQVAMRLEFRKDEPSARARWWPARQWAEGLGRMELVPVR
jgi:hypothetical protein